MPAGKDDVRLVLAERGHDLARFGRAGQILRQARLHGAAGQLLHGRIAQIAVHQQDAAAVARKRQRKLI